MGERDEAAREELAEPEDRDRPSPASACATTHTITVIRTNATARPANGAISDGFSTLCQRPDHCTTRQPCAMIADPMTPPISAWLELDGRPRYHVTRFQVIAPTRPARMIFSVIASGSTIPLAIVAATLKEMKAPTKLRIAAIATAFRGESARVETLVAIEFAVSWNPFVKSKKSATTTTATRVTCHRRGYAFLTTMFAITLAAVSQASSARSSAS